MGLAKGITIFAIGTGIGYFLGMSVSRRRLEENNQRIIDDLVEEELRSIQEVYDAKFKMFTEKHLGNKNATKEASNKAPAYNNYVDLVSIYEDNEPNEERSPVTEDDCIVTEEEVMNMPPMVIPSGEFGQYDEYDTITLSYYTDGVVTDELDEPIEDVLGSIGAEGIQEIRKTEDTCIFIVNHRLKCYYEVLKEDTAYRYH